MLYRQSRNRVFQGLETTVTITTSASPANARDFEVLPEFAFKVVINSSI